MGMTLSEKILLSRAEKKTIKAGDTVLVQVDGVMMHDLFAPKVREIFYAMGFKKVWDNERIAVINDHLVPAKTPDDIELHKMGRLFVEEQEIKRYHPGDGVCHILMIERGYARPGEIILGTDSHTCTYGGAGVFATGIGYTEMAAICGTGNIWLKVPETIKIHLEGYLSPGIASKDLILKIIGDLKADGAIYKALEFSGPAVAGLSLAERLTVSNMAVECGAKAGLFPADEITAAYYSELGEQSVAQIKADPDAVYCRTMHYDLTALTPQVSKSPNVDDVSDIACFAGLEIDQAFLGSCTNGRIDDLRIAAKILAGKKIHRNVRFIVTPGSQRIYEKALEEGIIQVLHESGAQITAPGCGLCSGILGGIVPNGDRMISSNNRNFLGRLGGLTSEIFLASPATIAASVLTGKITDPSRGS
ncbi:MAG: 3-isopropylmalate dehydratase large subunit [Spirochaetales bacterium]|nr:3-isopropylmalate dehydratase large subunit [Spirochaetales bacterium]